LVIEIDGSQHYEREAKKYDNFRTEVLSGYDLNVIRFTNEQIDKNFYGVCQYVQLTVNEKLKSC
jgi:very-short-patch-repair endonuclease